MKRLLIAVTLVCVLSGTAFAGDMPGGGRSVTGEMPGGGLPTASSQMVPGEMPADGSITSIETESNLVGTVLLILFTFIGR